MTVSSAPRATPPDVTYSAAPGSSSEPHSTTTEEPAGWKRRRSGASTGKSRAKWSEWAVTTVSAFSLVLPQT